MRNLAAVRITLTAPGATREAIVAMQIRRLRRILRHAYEQVPFYRRLFDRCRVRPDEIQTLADLTRLPITSKADLLAAPPADLLARGADPERLVVRRTSGSSGPPFTTYRSPGEELVGELQQLRIRRYFGLRSTDKQVIAVMDTRQRKAPSRLHRWANRLGIHRTWWLNPVVPAEELARRLLEIRPDVILGLTTILARLARFLKEQSLTTVRPRHLITSGEVLTPRMKREISEAFGAPVYDKYVCAELGHIAWECKTTGELHTCDDQLIVEVVRNGAPVQPGERGELVATSLLFRTMPFIRYQLADMVTRGREQCACGEPFATIRAIEGRMMDLFYLPDGRVMHPYELAGSMQQGVTWVKEFQLIQERLDLVIANIVPTEMPSAEEIARAEAMGRQSFGEQVELRIRFVDRIDWGLTGKLRHFRSHLSTDYDDLDWEAISEPRPPGAAP